MEVVVSGTRLSQPNNCPNQLFSLVQEMWNEEPSSRPTIEQISDRLQELLKELGYHKQVESEASSKKYFFGNPYEVPEI